MEGILQVPVPRDQATVLVTLWYMLSSGRPPHVATLSFSRRDVHILAIHLNHPRFLFNAPGTKDGNREWILVPEKG